jgi:hypothetical protein
MDSTAPSGDPGWAAVECRVAALHLDGAAAHAPEGTAAFAEDRLRDPTFQADTFLRVGFIVAPISSLARTIRPRGCTTRHARQLAWRERNDRSGGDMIRWVGWAMSLTDGVAGQVRTGSPVRVWESGQPVDDESLSCEEDDSEH